MWSARAGRRTPGARVRPLLSAQAIAHRGDQIIGAGKQGKDEPAGRRNNAEDKYPVHRLLDALGDEGMDEAG